MRLPEFRIEQYRDENHQEDTPHFISGIGHRHDHRVAHIKSVRKQTYGEFEIVFYEARGKFGLERCLIRAK